MNKMFLWILAGVATACFGQIPPPTADFKPNVMFSNCPPVPEATVRTNLSDYGASLGTMYLSSQYQWHHLVPKGGSHYWRAVVETVENHTFSPHSAEYGLLLSNAEHADTYIRTQWHYDYNLCLISIMIAQIMRAEIMADMASGEAERVNKWRKTDDQNVTTFDWENFRNRYVQLYMKDVSSIETDPAKTTGSGDGRIFTAPFVKVYSESLGGDGSINDRILRNLLNVSWALLIAASPTYASLHEPGHQTDMPYAWKKNETVYDLYGLVADDPGRLRSWTGLSGRGSGGGFRNQKAFYLMNYGDSGDDLTNKLSCKNKRQLSYANFEHRVGTWGIARKIVQDIFENPDRLVLQDTELAESSWDKGEVRTEFVPTYVVQSMFLPNPDSTKPTEVFDGENPHRHPDKENLKKPFATWLNAFAP